MPWIISSLVINGLIITAGEEMRITFEASALSPIVRRLCADHTTKPLETFTRPTAGSSISFSLSDLQGALPPHCLYYCDSCDSFEEFSFEDVANFVRQKLV